MRLNPNGTDTAVMITAWPSTGTISLSARPMTSEERRSGVTSMRSCAPVVMSWSRLAPVVDVPNSTDMTMIPGTNHWSVAASPSPEVRTSSGPNSPRKNSGCSIPKTSWNGSRRSGRSSRSATVHTSWMTPVGRGTEPSAIVRAAPAGAGRVVDIVRTPQVEVERGMSRATPRAAVTPRPGPRAGTIRAATAREIEEDVVERRLGEIGAGREVGLEALRGVVGDHAPVVHDHDSLGHRIGFVEVVRREEDGHAGLLAQAQDVVPEVRAVLRIEPRGGLVEEQERRPMDQPERNVEPAPLPTGEGHDLLVGLVGELELLEQLVGAQRDAWALSP